MIREFGENYYQNTVYLNFETEPLLTHLFSESIDPKKLIPKIERFCDTNISPGATLLKMV